MYVLACVANAMENSSAALFPILLFSREAANQGTVQSVAQVIGSYLVHIRSDTTVSCTYRLVCIVRPQHPPRRFLVGTLTIGPFQIHEPRIHLRRRTSKFLIGNFCLRTLMHIAESFCRKGTLRLGRRKNIDQWRTIEDISFQRVIRK